MVDSPTNNFCTYNAVQGRASGGGGSEYQTLSEGNLKSKNNSASDAGCIAGTIPFTDGKWYCEFYPEGATGLTEYPWLGITDTASAMVQVGIAGSEGGAYLSNGNRNVAGSATSYGATFTDGDIIGMAVDADNGAVYFSKNNTWQDSGVPTSGASKTGALETWTGGTIEMVVAIASYPEASRSVTVNFGQDSSFAGEVTAQGNQDSNEIGDFYYEPPTDFLALCTSNLPDPEIKLPGDNFNTVLYTGNASTNAISGVGLAPDFVWAKDRAANYHGLWDSVRGVNKVLYSNTTTAETTSATTGLASFDSDGFTLGANSTWNDTSHSCVAWSWKAGGASTVTNNDGTTESEVSVNSTAGFSIVTYTGDGANATVGHGLSEVPTFLMIKCRSSVADWRGGTTLVSGKTYADGNGYYYELNDSKALTNPGSAVVWGSTPANPTATVFSVGPGHVSTNQDTDTYVAYAFHSVEGYSKIGLYEGNSNIDGPFIYTGFRPAFFMLKYLDGADWWFMFDSKRPGYNMTDESLVANDNYEENSSSAGQQDIDILSNGVKITDAGGGNNSSGTYLYIAFAESPFKYANAR